MNYQPQLFSRISEPSTVSNMTTTIELEVFSCHRVDDYHGNLKVPELQGSAANLTFHKVGPITNYKWSDMGPL